LQQPNYCNLERQPRVRRLTHIDQRGAKQLERSNAHSPSKCHPELVESIEFGRRKRSGWHVGEHQEAVSQSASSALGEVARIDPCFDCCGHSTKRSAEIASRD